MRLRFTASIVAITGLMLTGCSGQTSQGTPGPTSGGSTTATTSSLPPGTPNVPNALDVSKFRAAPCTSLTSAQLQQLNAVETGKPTSGDLSTCDWGDSRQKSKISVTIQFPPEGHGLADIYSQKDSYKVFESIASVNGYPGVIALSADGRGQGICQVTIGVSNQQTVEVGVSAWNSTTPCTANQSVAAAVIDTLKKG